MSVPEAKKSDVLACRRSCSRAGSDTGGSYQSAKAPDYPLGVYRTPVCLSEDEVVVGVGLRVPQFARSCC